MAAFPTSVHPLLSTAEMRAVEARMFASGTDSFDLMSEAGSAVAATVAAHAPRRPVLVLCGPGNNGGDGFIAARCLRGAGHEVAVAAAVPRGSAKGDAARAAASWGSDVLDLGADMLAPLLARGPRVVDGLFGIGLDRPIAGDLASVIGLVNQSGLDVTAIDIPSGISADTGLVLGAAFRAKRTVTFGWLKAGHVLLPGRLHCGQVEIARLGFSDADLPADIATSVNEPALWVHLLPHPGPLDHKYSRGHALVIGGEAMPGAGRLASLAARRMGAGMLSVAAPQRVLPLFLADQPGIIARPASRAEDYVEILMDSRITAVLVGSGLLPDAATRETVLNVLASGRAAVVDGGGLTAFADRPDDLFRSGRADIVLTPHEGEFTRLFPDLGAGLGRLERVRLATRRSGCTVLLKGADTVIAEPERQGTSIPPRRCVNRDASPHLATAGSGDVLAGLVLGLLAQGMPPFEAAAASAWIHAEAGNVIGPGLIAEDIPARVPEIRQRLGG